MKKIYLVAAISLMGLSQAQNRPSASEMAPVLEKMAQIKNPALAFPTGYFTTQEESLITAYFAPDERTIDLSANKAVGDAYVLDGRSASKPYGYFPVMGPYNLTSTGSIPGPRAIYADDFDRNGVLYALDNDARKVVIVNPDNAAITEVATITGIPVAETLSGLSFNYKDDKFYVLGGATTGTNLYRLDVVTGSAVLIGTTPGISGIWLVIDNDGMAFTADITNDNLHKIDLTTGVGTLVGPLGTDLKFAQEADVNTADNKIYMAAYNGGGAGGIYTVNKTTGAATLVGATTANNAEYTMYSIRNPAPVMGVSDAVLKGAVSIYPNPVGETLNLVTKYKVESLEIYNSAGQLVKSLKSISDKVNVSTLKSGVYFAKIKVNGQSESVKFIKK